MRIAGFFGFKGSGKDAASQVLIRHGFKKFAFADPIKDMLATVFSWERDLLEGSTAESRVWRETPDTWWSNKLEIPNFTPRLAMTMVGTDILRKYLHNDLWIASLQRRIEMSGSQDIVLTDIRHRHELMLLKSLKPSESPILSHIVRGPFPEYWGATALGNDRSMEYLRIYMNDYHPDVHISEWEWNSYARDGAQRIDNDGNLQDLENKVKLVYGNWL